jgi:hypothetical protein
MQRVVAVLIVLAVLALLALGVYGLCSPKDDALACVRDLAIIVLVLETFIVTLLLLLIVILFGRLISTIQDEVAPVLQSAKRTVDTVQGTTTFVSNSIVAPLISLAGFGAGVRGTLRAILARRKTRRS